MIFRLNTHYHQYLILCKWGREDGQNGAWQERDFYFSPKILIPFSTHLPIVAGNTNNTEENKLRIVKNILGHHIVKLVFCRIMFLSIQHKLYNLKQSHTFLSDYFFSRKNINKFQAHSGNTKNKFWRHNSIATFIHQTKLQLILLCLTIHLINKINQLAKQMLLLPMCTEYTRDCNSAGCHLPGPEVKGIVKRQKYSGDVRPFLNYTLCASIVYCLYGDASKYHMQRYMFICLCAYICSLVPYFPYSFK